MMPFYYEIDLGLAAQRRLDIVQKASKMVLFPFKDICPLCNIEEVNVSYRVLFSAQHIALSPLSFRAKDKSDDAVKTCLFEKIESLSKCQGNF